MRHSSAAVPSQITARPSQRGYELAQVNRPTEWAALRQATRKPAPAVDVLDLFEGILNAHATGDRHGLSLMGHAIARLADNSAAVTP